MSSLTKNRVPASSLRVMNDGGYICIVTDIFKIDDNDIPTCVYTVGPDVLTSSVVRVEAAELIADIARLQRWIDELYSGDDEAFAGRWIITGATS
mgnify:CR=1 FL=1